MGVKVGRFTWNPNGQQTGQLTLDNELNAAAALLLNNGVSGVQVNIYETRLRGPIPGAINWIEKPASPTDGNLAVENGGYTIYRDSGTGWSELGAYGDSTFTGGCVLEYTVTDVPAGNGVGLGIANVNHSPTYTSDIGWADLDHKFMVQGDAGTLKVNVYEFSQSYGVQWAGAMPANGIRLKIVYDDVNIKYYINDILWYTSVHHTMGSGNEYAPDCVFGEADIRMRDIYWSADEAGYEVPKQIISGVIGGNSLNPKEAKLTVVQDKYDTEFVPYKFYTQEQGFDYLPPAGTIIVWGAETFLLEADSR